MIETLFSLLTDPATNADLTRSIFHTLAVLYRLYPYILLMGDM